MAPYTAARLRARQLADPRVAAAHRRLVAVDDRWCLFAWDRLVALLASTPEPGVLRLGGEMAAHLIAGYLAWDPAETAAVLAALHEAGLLRVVRPRTQACDEPSRLSLPVVPRRLAPEPPPALLLAGGGA